MISYIFFIILLALSAFLAFKISIADLHRRIIPDAYLFPLMLIGLTLISFYSFPISIQSATIGAIFGYTLSAITGLIFEHFISKKDSKAQSPIGMGDIKLLGVGGLWLGTNGLAFALIIACITGSIWSRHKKQKFIPFAPFFIFGGFLSLIISLFLL
ncbi:MAG: prepilin peptidase [Alphaproteobacteria bacterium]|nr:prepilin peptidase [Alphaproteobacteria bacterium]